MKKFLVLLFALVLSVGLAACGSEGSDSEAGTNNNDNSADENENVEQDDNESKDEGSENEDKADDGNVQESEIGKMTITYKNKELEENAESGPITLSVSALQVGELEVAEDYKEIFDNKDKLTAITMELKAENSSDDTVGIYPDQATITTDAGDQVDADVFLSDQVGGDFIGKVKKEGSVYFFVDTPAEEIGQINLIVDGAHDEDYESIGDQIKMSFTTK